MTGAIFVYAHVYACEKELSFLFLFTLCFMFTGVCSGHTDV